ncbi:regulator of hemoglobinization and erythroid cell expansion protein [Nothoprocta perdicaria]|uniref:regulator of hemoglobinization and erythroid cell expansion protein n=1 Tax=Nothoprocta perdicaria TaxID=30464 RepID=UPI000E1BD9AF|nr:regulator of hemoglobinization and erythroid cell expansion protein [Nothoprocta perdicaria]
MDCSPWWALAASSAVTLVLHALLLATLYVMLGRRIERLRGGSEAGGGTATEPAAAAAPAGDAAPSAAYVGSSDTSSETSDDSDSGPSAPRAERSLNYSSLRFPAPAADYENMKTGPDYVNVDPKKKKADFWTCSGSAAAKAIEYTEVKL